VKIRWFLLGIALVVLAFGVLYITDSLQYAMERLDGWGMALEKDLSADMQATVWQTMNSLYAIGSGGLTGLGLGQSREKYLYLPEPQNDFVFAVVVEELGLIGGIIILAFFALFVWRGIMISLRAKDRFGMFLGVGLVSQVGLQVVLNILVITDTLPNTGISLPFFSYGGSSLVMLLAQMGIVLSISRNSNINKT
ncbi:MAG: FtsW/RodA/SpoVE family cell cycle protein, partial [Acutalibacteraceae bacterium]|nr:FtsW/RodA/SpoVE family cell cycle protein [Acutalibacteraceae bacterium]